MDTFISNVIYIRTMSSGGSKGPTGDHAPVDTSFLPLSIPIIYGLYDVLNSRRQLESVFKPLKCFCFWGHGPPDTVSVKIKFFSFQSFDIDSIMNVSMSKFFLEPRFNQIYVGFKYAPNCLNYILHLSKGFRF